MALTENRKWTTEPVLLKDGVLKTNGALVTMKFPADWQASKTSRATMPGVADETFLFCTTGTKDERSSLGVFYAGRPEDADDGRVRRDEIFDKHISMRGGSADATAFQAETGPLRSVTRLGNALLNTAPHAVLSEEADCLSLRTEDLNGLRAAVFEFESKRLAIKSLEYCLDVRGNGSVLYSLFFKAPTNLYLQQLEIAIKAFQSTMWRTDFDSAVSLDVVD